MESKPNYNAALAELFRRVAKLDHVLWAIANSDIDILKWYEDTGDLSALPIRYVGPTSKQILTWIIELGVDEAKRLYREEKRRQKYQEEEGMRRQTIHPSPSQRKKYLMQLRMKLMEEKILKKEEPPP